MDPVLSFVDVLRQFRREFDRLSSNNELDAFVKELRLWLSHPSVIQSSKDREIGRALWGLRGILWTFIERRPRDDVTVVPLLLCVWDLQYLCDECQLFADAFEGISAQYNVLKKLIEAEVFHAASPRSRLLYCRLMQTFKGENSGYENLEPEVIPVPARPASQRAIKVAWAVMLTVMTCGSQAALDGTDAEWFPFCCRVLQSLDAWTASQSLTEAHVHYVKGTVHHAERILSMVPRRLKDKQLQQNWNLLKSFVLSFACMSHRIQRSPSTSIAACIAALPHGCNVDVCWECVQCLSSESETRIEAMKVMTGFLWKCLKAGDSHRDIGILMKRLLPSKCDLNDQMPQWMVPHLLTCLVISTQSGVAVCLTREDGALIDKLMRQYQSKMVHKDELTAMLEAMRQLSYVLKADEEMIHRWADRTETAEWITSALMFFSKTVLTVQRDHLMDNLTPEKRCLVISQAAMAVFKTQCIDRTSLEEIDDRLLLLLSLTTVLVKELPMPMSGSGYRGIPHDLRAVMDCATNCGVLLQTNHRMEASLHIYRMLCMLYACAYNHWERLGEKLHCLLSKIVNTGHRVTKMILTHDQLSHPGMSFLQAVIVQLITVYSDQAVDDLKKFVQTYCKILLHEMKAGRSSLMDVLANALTRQDPDLAKHPEVILRLIRFEILGWMKHSPNIDNIPAVLKCLKPRCFVLHGNLQQNGNRFLQIWFDALLMVFRVYTGAVDVPQALATLKEMSESIQRHPDQSFTTETQCLCRCLIFLLETMDNPPASATEGERNDRREIQSIPMADAGDVISIIDCWNDILASDSAVLDPELSLILLHQCLALSHARCWTSMERPLFQIMQAICTKYGNLTTESTKHLSRASLPIPYCRRLDTKAARMIEKELMSMHDPSSKNFQRRISLQLSLARWHLGNGRMTEARRIVSDARRYALGLFKSFADEGTAPGVRARSFLSGDAWQSQGLYAFCLMTMAEVAIEFEEPNEGKHFVMEAMKVIEGLRSRILLCMAELLITRLELETQDLERAETAFSRAEQIYQCQVDQGTCHELNEDHTGYFLTQFQELRMQLEMEHQCVHSPASEMKRWLYLPSSLQLDWSLQLDALRMRCLTTAAAGTLCALNAIGYMTDALYIAARLEAPGVDLYRFLLSACQWKDKGASEIGERLHLFGLHHLIDAFRDSLDLGLANSPLLSDIRLKLTSIQSVNAEIRQMIQILEFAVKDMHPTDLKTAKILLLLMAWNGSNEVTSVFQEISALVGYLLANSSYLHAAAYFLTVSLSNGLRLQTLYHLEKKAKEIGDVHALKYCLTIQPFSIQLDSRCLQNVEEECRDRMEEILAEGANNACLVSIQLPSKSCMSFQMIRERLILVRYSKDDCPIIVLFPSHFSSRDESIQTSKTLQDILGSLSVLLKENRASFEHSHASEEDRAVVEKWWNDRRELDRQLKVLVQSIEDGLGPWKLLLDGRRVSDFSKSESRAFISHRLLSHESHGKVMTSDVLVLTLATLREGRNRLSGTNIQEAADDLEDITRGSINKQQCVAFLSHLSGFSVRKEVTPIRAASTVRKSIRIGRMRSSAKIRTTEDVLPYLSPPPLEPLPDDALATPLKSITRDVRYHNETVGVMEGLQTADSECSSTLMILGFDVQQFPWESLPSLQGQNIYRLPNLYLARYIHKLQQRRRHEGEGPRCLDLQSAFYVLDPEGDLADSRTTFQDWFRSIPSWKQIVPQQDPSILKISRDLVDCLISKDMFLYFGHNCAETLLHPKELRKHVIRSGALLMGCSSGRLKSAGEASILEYLASGSCCCIGNLWAVSDAEINRFSKALIEMWMITKSPVDMGLTVSKSRSASRLRYLIGAAPVVYGIPTRIQFTQGDTSSRHG